MFSKALSPRVPVWVFGLAMMAMLTSCSHTRTDSIADSPKVSGSHRPATASSVERRDVDDVWERIRLGFGMSDLYNERVDRLQNAYLRQPEYLQRMFNRSARYLHYIVEEVEKRNMPTEIALLPMVESAFNPTAHSSARASGLWQFIPSTGKNYKLAQNRWQDDRRDVIASTNAALNYLQKLHDMHGDWHLALASYNRGENGVARAVARNLAQGKPGEYSALALPQETRNYVPKLQALKNIIAHPKRYGITLPYVANKQALAEVPAPRGIDLAEAASYAEMSIEDFIAYNPGYNLPVIVSDTRKFVVPVDRVERLSKKLADFSEQNKGWRTYALASGERLADIAERHQIEFADLIKLNRLSRKAVLPPGYVLIVPGEGCDLAGALAVTEILPKHTERRVVKRAKSKKGRAGHRKVASRGKGKVAAARKKRKLRR